MMRTEISKRQRLVDMLDCLNLSEQDFYERFAEPLQIFKVPDYLKHRNPTAYEPKMVSIGPYHFGKPKLEPMQFNKIRAVAQFIKISPTKATERQYLDSLMQVVFELRKSYDPVEEMDEWRDDVDFAKLMMVDGIFLLEFLRILNGGETYDYAGTDPLFGRHNLSCNHLIMEDLLLLENQIPYLVLLTLHSVSKGLGVEEARFTLSSLMGGPRGFRGHHLLDVYTRGFQLGVENNFRLPRARAVQISALKLFIRGIEFQTVENCNMVKFVRRTRMLSLPSLVIDQNTLHLINNSKAYEVKTGPNRELDSKIYLMNSLIQSADDVRLFCSKGIIFSHLGSDQAVVDVMKELAKNVMPENVDSGCNHTMNEVAQYYYAAERLRPNFLEWAIENRILIFCAGFVMYALTVIQVVYSALSYHRNK